MGAVVGSRRVAGANGGAGRQGVAKLSALVRERQDLVVEWQKRDGARVAAVSQPPGKRDAVAEGANTARLAAIDASLAEIDIRLKAAFPDYAALASPQPLSVEEVQAQLGADEALVLTLDTPEWQPTPEETFIWAVTKTEVRWVRSELGTAALRREVAALRCGLDADAWHGDGKQRCANLLELPPGGTLLADAPLPFDAARAHALYKGLFGEVEDLIVGKHLLIVPSGALTTLPFQVLVTKAPASTELKTAAWLVRDHALSVLPSVASLKALRRTAKPSAGDRPMLGFANPLLDGNQSIPSLAPITRSWRRGRAPRPAVRPHPSSAPQPCARSPAAPRRCLRWAGSPI